jgi:hypothetical protein
MRSMRGFGLEGVRMLTHGGSLALVCLLLSFVLLAQVKLNDPLAGATQKSARNPATLEAYLRHLFGPKVELRVSPLKPSAKLPGYSEAIVHVAGDNLTQIQPVVEQLLIRGAQFVGDGVKLELSLARPTQMSYLREIQRALGEKFVLDVSVFVSSDGQRIVLGQVFDTAPKPVAPSLKSGPAR